MIHHSLPSVARAGRSAVFLAALISLNMVWVSAPVAAFEETPSLAEAVADGTLPPIGERLPENPSVVNLESLGGHPGHHGGTLRLIMARSKDVRMMVVYGYARLVGYDRDLKIKPDILERVEVEEGRTFTLHLRKGHKWSDGQPFTTEDFRYYWEDIANNKDMSPGGIPRSLMVDGKPPLVTIIDETTVRYSWPKPNPFFLTALAGTTPLYIYKPAHYLKQFHAKYADPEELAEKVKAGKRQNWVALQFRMGRQYRNNNPDLPTLQPWVLATKPPSDRFIFKRNPYYHRVDDKGKQLPYIDQVKMVIANSKLIPLKVSTGEADLQARSIQFNNFTFLKQAGKRNNFEVRLWQSAKGSQMALFPNLNVNDPVWREVVRKVEFRRALSMAINRQEINQTIYFGLALEGNNTVLPQSSLYKPYYETAWTNFDTRAANKLLDSVGLDKRNSNGIRLLPDGRPMEITVETAGEDSEQADILELVRDGWRAVGIELHTKPVQREVFRNRIFSGSTLISVWFGLENAIPNAELAPNELAPTSQQQLQWPKWGQYFETNGSAGEPVDMEKARMLSRLYTDWIEADSHEDRKEAWTRMLQIHADEMFTIGLVRGVLQPVVVSNTLRNVPKKGIYNWEPGAHFGIYRPDTFWFDTPGKSGSQ